MDPIRYRVAISPYGTPTSPELATVYATPYFPDGCPDHMPNWPASDGHYAPHITAVCPGCLPAARLDVNVSDPFPAPAASPMIYALASPAPAPTPDTTRHDPALLRLLRGAGFTRMAWLPLLGFPDPCVFVADHPTGHTRITLHSLGLEFHLRTPDGEPLQGCLGPHIDLAILTTALRSTGYATPVPNPNVGKPSLPAGARQITSIEAAGLILTGDRYLAADDAAHLIATGDHAGGQHPDPAVDLGLIDAVRSGRILAARLPDGALVFNPNPRHSPST
ncbi:hypothetical protein [Frankia sp. ArI3]|uniref:hypothetical protein n=1 Tax=Frankia sp. ArI3 TaxID=1858 RepID=UPI001C6FCC6E|nr:hypothetical protein [Frankia sp. ArI3]